MTENTQFLKQTIGLQKTLFNDTYDWLEKYQENATQLTQTIIDRNTHIPDELKGTLGNWTSNLKEGQRQFKNLIDEGFKTIEGLAD